MAKQLQKGNKDLYYHEWLKRLIKRDAIMSQILGITSSDADPSLWTQELQEYYNSMNNGLSFDFGNLINAIRELDDNSFSIPHDRTCWINADISADDTVNRIFKTYASAVLWIQANGSLSSSNKWCVKASTLDSITCYDNILLDVNGIETLIWGRTTAEIADRIGYINSYNLNGGGAYVYNSNVGSISGSGLFYAFNSVLGSKSLVSGRTLVAYNCHISSVTNNNGSVFIYNCQIVGTFTNTAGTSRLHDCQVFGTTTVNGGGLFTYSHQGAVVRNGGTWTNEGELVDSRAFGKKLTTLCKDTQELAKQVNEYQTTEEEIEIFEIRGHGEAELTGVFADGDTITIGTEVWIIHEVMPYPATIYNVLLRDDNEDTLEDLFNAINESIVVSAGIDGTTLTITSYFGGSASNIAFETTSAALTLSPALGFLEGGADVYPLVDGYSTIELTGDTVITLPVTFAREMQVRIVQDAVGGHDVTFESTLPILWENGVIYTPTADADAIDIIKLFTNGTEWYITDVINGLQLAGD
jgi:hypothetical protein